jgi:hypothetical protein
VSGVDGDGLVTLSDGDFNFIFRKFLFLINFNGFLEFKSYFIQNS